MSATLEPQRSLVPDAILMQRLAQRDSTALIELERRHRGSLYAQVYGILMDSTQAERVVRDVFAQIWHAAGRFTGTRSAWSWLRDTATQLARAERAAGVPKTSRRLME
jgi:DNA-directed RNA polymerase specialized sigma24 family protein